MKRLAPDEEARRKAKNATAACFESFAKVVKDSSKSRR
jgi:hypothetical protein